MVVTSAPHKSIKRRILVALLGVAAVTAISFAAVALSAVWFVGNHALHSNVHLGEHAVTVSKQALSTQAKAEIDHLASDQATLFAARLQRIRSRAEALAAYTTLVLQHKADADQNAWKRSVEGDTPIHTAPGISLAARPDDVALCRQIRGFLYWTQASEQSIEFAEVATPGGIYAVSPDKNEQVRSFGAVDRLTPYSTPLPKSTPDMSGYDPRAQDWYRNAAQAHTFTWSNPLPSLITRRLGIMCSTPVQGPDHRLAAVITIFVSIRSLEQELMNSRLKDSEVLLVRDDLGIIAEGGQHAPDESHDQIPDSEFFRLDGSDREQTRLAANIRAGRHELIQASYRGTDDFIAYAPIGDTRLSVVMLHSVSVVERPMAETEGALKSMTGSITRQINRYIGVIFLIAALLFLTLAAVVMAYASRLADRMVAPIQSLDNSAQILATGDLDHRIEIRTGDEIEHLADTFNQMASSLKQYTVTLAETVAARERLQSELTLASQIQHALLPRIFPAFPDRPEFDLYALMDPAREVGGDFYDFFFVDDHRLCFLIGDVSDKGIPAALYMMVVKTMLKTEGLRGLPPDQILARVNNQLALDNDNGMFATIFCAILDINTGEMQVSNAGHNPPMIATDGGVRFMTVPPGFVLGPMPNSPYRTAPLTLAPGDLILLYTDGVTEAKNSVSEMFGNSRLRECVEKAGKIGGEQVVGQVMGAIRTFVAGAQQYDDITMLCLKFQGTVGSQPAETIS